MIEIDGSYGEGGGQILRTALSLSCLFKKPFRIFNIRKGRKKPGLMPQHLTAVRAAQMISAADVTGDYAGSAELVFSPGEVKGGDFFFDIGTAGSTSLVLQTLIPSLVFLGNPLSVDREESRQEEPHQKTSVTLKGGTHVPFSPSYDYLAGVFSHFLKEIGIKIEFVIESYGFYPKGGGKIRAYIYPTKDIRSLKILERGRLLALKGCSGVGNLPLSIAERQKNSMIEKIKSGMDSGYPVEIELLNVPTPGQGTFTYLQSDFENAVAGFTSLGERGKRAETVGDEVAADFFRYYSTGSALEPHIADQIVLYLSLSREKSVFSTSAISRHLMTNLWVIGLFHTYHYAVEGDVGSPGKVEIN
ncbi:MAG: RNA 3'-terminal phosphate cyclase [Nitrospirota bacterium]